MPTPVSSQWVEPDGRRVGIATRPAHIADDTGRLVVTTDPGLPAVAAFVDDNGRLAIDDTETTGLPTFLLAGRGVVVLQ